MLDYQLSPSELTLSGQLKVQYLDTLKEALLKAAQQGGLACLNLSQVREVDTAGLQLLLAWLRQPRPQFIPRLTDVPEVVARALRLGGLQSHFAPFME